jgi:hypothetical protein
LSLSHLSFCFSVWILPTTVPASSGEWEFHICLCVYVCGKHTPYTVLYKYRTHAVFLAIYSSIPQLVMHNK